MTMAVIPRVVPRVPEISQGVGSFAVKNDRLTYTDPRDTTWVFVPNPAKFIKGYTAGATFATVNFMNPALLPLTPAIAHAMGMQMGSVSMWVREDELAE